MRNKDRETKEELHINEGDRVRVYIPYPDDKTDGTASIRKDSARVLALNDYVRYNRRRGMVIETIPYGVGGPQYIVEFEDPERTLAENPPNVKFNPDDLRLIEEGEDDEVAMTDGGHQTAYRVTRYGLGGKSIDAYYADEDDARNCIKAIADKDGWQLDDGSGDYPWATDGSRSAGMTPIRIRAEFSGLPGGGDE